jgi:hypothetical protein
VLAAATNNGPAYQGASVILLDRDHCSGASRDSLMMVDSPLPDSSAVRVILPQWERRFMALCGAAAEGSRLQAGHIRTHVMPGGEVVVSVDVRVNDWPVVVMFDDDLRPLHAEPSDEFLRLMQSWSAEDRKQFLDGLDGWLAGHYRYGALARR